MLCDRRQIGQAVTNILKNAAEAIEARITEGVTNTPGVIDISIAANAAPFPARFSSSLAVLV